MVNLLNQPPDFTEKTKEKIILAECIEWPNLLLVARHSIYGTGSNSRSPYCKHHPQTLSQVEPFFPASYPHSSMLYMQKCEPLDTYALGLEDVGKIL
jgi:hypothetical protein